MRLQEAGALCAAAVCVLLGMGAARRLSRREALLNQWDEALSRMEGAVTHSGSGLIGVLRAGNMPALAALARRLEERPPAPPEALLSSLPWEENLSRAERDTLRACLLSLFAPTLTQQEKALSQAREEFSALRRACREKRERDGRLYVSLGWLGGAAAFILLC